MIVLDKSKGFHTQKRVVQQKKRVDSRRDTIVLQSVLASQCKFKVCQYFNFLSDFCQPIATICITTSISIFSLIKTICQLSGITRRQHCYLDKWWYFLLPPLICSLSNTEQKKVAQGLAMETQGLQFFFFFKIATIGIFGYCEKYCSFNLRSNLSGKLCPSSALEMYIAKAL